MKKNKIYKRVFALLSATTISLFSGCSDKNVKTNKDACIHLTIYFEDTPITFKECDNFDIYTENNDGMLYYKISNVGDKIIYKGITNNFNYCEFNHKYDSLIYELSKQKKLIK